MGTFSDNSCGTEDRLYKMTVIEEVLFFPISPHIISSRKRGLILVAYSLLYR